MDELPRVSYSPSSTRFAAIRYRELQELKEQLWNVYKKKTHVMMYESEPHFQLYIQGIKMVRIVDNDDVIYYAIDTSHDEYYEIGLPYVLRALLSVADKLEDYVDEDRSKKTSTTERNH